MKTVALIAVAAAVQSGAPSAAQFEAALAAACPEQRVQTRNVACARAEEGSIQFACRYELRGPDGAWTAHEAILQQAEGEWVWIDGPTPCDDDDASLN